MWRMSLYITSKRTDIAFDWLRLLTFPWEKMIFTTSSTNRPDMRPFSKMSNFPSTVSFEFLNKTQYGRPSFWQMVIFSEIHSTHHNQPIIRSSNFQKIPPIPANIITIIVILQHHHNSSTDFWRALATKPPREHPFFKSSNLILFVWRRGKGSQNSIK